MKVLAVIPARYASARFPGKPLVEIAGVPMVIHVYRRCREAAGIEKVIVATDDERVVSACARFGAEVELTGTHFQTGTDRVAEIARRHPDFEGVLNVQGDEPAIPVDTVTAVARHLAYGRARIVTACAPLAPEDVGDPNIVKVVLMASGRVLYFSRSRVPFARDPHASDPPPYWRHIGIYGFQRDTLLELASLPPSALERAEGLEQLRWLEAGYEISCERVTRSSISVDTPEDLKALLAAFPN